MSLEGVLFEIDADPQMVTTKPFADISKYSNFTDEKEVLFMIGSIFRLKNIYCDTNNIWIIEMCLCSDDEYNLKQVLLHMKRQIRTGETNLRTLGKLLWKMGKLDLAEKYFKRLLDELPIDDHLFCILCEDLGEIASQAGDYDMSIKWHQRFLEIKKQNDLDMETNASKTNTRIDATYKKEGVTIAGGNGRDDNLNQLSHPLGIFIDDEQTIYIANNSNHRIMEWKYNAITGLIVAGGNGCGNHLNQLNEPIDVLIDKADNSLIISDSENRRVLQCFRDNSKRDGQIIIEDIDCWGLGIDKNGSLYVSDFKKHEVRRWHGDKKNAIVVAGGHGKGNQFHQLNFPTFIFVDENCSLYVSDSENHRVMKWLKDESEGVVVAGGNGQGNSLTQLSSPRGVIVDRLGQIYVADFGNHRVMCWCEGAENGIIVAGGNGEGKKSNQLYYPEGLSFDRQGNLYVADLWNHRVQKFEIN
ncbi:unnamed protein product [Adineta steineri]|uniref:Uncharacterized protein n=1 Tax=Adineta steineri TaxID=433720 RepID=A0A816AQV2_9BILA|nr:unnamed protein product [Adineta steineri]CAF1598906.1 unnamed protein product [Adineta steineri]